MNKKKRRERRKRKRKKKNKGVFKDTPTHPPPPHTHTHTINLKKERKEKGVEGEEALKKPYFFLSDFSFNPEAGFAQNVIHCPFNKDYYFFFFFFFFKEKFITYCITHISNYFITFKLSNYFLSVYSVAILFLSYVIYFYLFFD